MKNKNLAIFIFLAAGIFAAPKIVSAATLYVSPSAGNYSVGQTFTVTLRTNTQTAAVNTAEAHLTYSADTLDLVSIAQGTTFFLPAPGSPSKVAGKVYFGGGLPTPGYTGSSGLVGTMIFRAKAVGNANVSIATGEVLLNDGFGTNALNSSSGATYRIVAAAAKPTTPTPQPATPIVTPTLTPTSSVAVVMQPISFFHKTLTMPLYLALLFILCSLLLLVLLLLILLGRRKKSYNDSEIRQIQVDIDESLENLKQEISNKFLSLTAKSSEELFEKETAAAKQLRGGIVKTRKRIDKNISRLKKKSVKVKDEIQQ